MIRKQRTGVLFFILCLCGQTSIAQGLIINELLASNDNVIFDDFFEFNDWVEIHNTGGILNLAGYYLSDDLDSLDKWKFPDTNPGLTTILPGGHLMIWCDKDPEQGEDHANFSLSSDGETVYLVDTDGSFILDSVSFGQQQNDISFGRSCDGCDDWIYFDVPTPEATNEYIQVEPSLVFINECQLENESTLFDEAGEYDAWLEVFNPNEYQVNLAGYEFTLDGNSYVVENDAPWLTTIEANGHIVFWLDGEPSQGANHLGITSSPSSEMIILSGSDGLVIDAIQWDASTASNNSYGRSLDGSTLWTEFSTPTPRVSNSLQIIPGGPVVINEVQTWNVADIQDNFLESEDWIELHNPSSSPVDIAGYYVSDRIDNPQKWKVPVGIADSTVIMPGGFLLLFADDDEEQGWNHMDFKLNNTGEHAALRSPDGFTVIDSLNIPNLPADVSWGRTFDAALPWIEFIVTTPNASNGTLGINPTEAASFWIPSPNPSRPNGSIAFPEGGALYNVMGHLIKTWSLPSEQSLPSTEGLYVIQFESGRSVRLVLAE